MMICCCCLNDDGTRCATPAVRWVLVGEEWVPVCDAHDDGKRQRKEIGS